MMSHDEALLDAVAALAVGALAPDEAADAQTHLTSCPSCRAEFGALSAAVDAVATAATATPAMLSDANAARLKQTVLHAAVAARPPAELASRPPAAAPGGHAHAVPRDALVQLEPGISFAVVAGEGITLVYWVFEPPCTALPREFHPQTQAGIVLDGLMTLHYGDGSAQTCRPGDMYAIAPGMPHGASFPEPTVLFDVYTPNRTDFEEQYRALRDAT
jgi:quercetin dioxygenase-like cupin family protein